MMILSGKLDPPAVSGVEQSPTPRPTAFLPASIAKKGDAPDATLAIVGGPVRAEDWVRE
jgi:hypothetical protein